MTDATVTPLSRSKLLSDIATTLGTRIIIFPLAVAASVITARVLEPTGRGIYTTALTVGELVVAFTALGLSKAAIYHLARDPTRRPDVRTTAVGLAAASGLLASIALVAFALLVAPTLLPEVPRSALLLVVPFGFIAVIRSMWEGFLRAEQRVRHVNASLLAFSLTFVGALGVFALAGDLDTDAAIGIRVGAGAVMATLLALWLRGRTGARGGSFRPKIAHNLFAYSLPFAVIGLMQMLSLRMDVLLLQRWEGAAVVGHYSISVALGEFLWYLPLAAGFVLFPRAAAMARDDDAASESAGLARWTLLFTGLAAVLLFIFAPPLIRLMYGDSYAPAVEPLRLLLVGLVAGTWYQVLSGYLAGRGAVRVLAIITTIGFGINLALNLALIPAAGAEGAAVASAISYSLVGVLTLVIFCRHTGTPLVSAAFPTLTEIRARTSRLLA